MKSIIINDNHSTLFKEKFPLPDLFNMFTLIELPFELAILPSLQIDDIYSAEVVSETLKETSGFYFITFSHSEEYDPIFYQSTLIQSTQLSFVKNQWKLELKNIYNVNLYIIDINDIESSLFKSFRTIVYLDKDFESKKISILKKNNNLIFSSKENEYKKLEDAEFNQYNSELLSLFALLKSMFTLFSSFDGKTPESIGIKKSKSNFLRQYLSFVEILINIEDDNPLIIDFNL